MTFTLPDDLLRIGNKSFSSRLMLGTGKYRNFSEAKKSIEASGCEILTVAVRRAQTAQVDGIAQLLNGFDWSKLWLLPNTAGCQTAEEAIRLAFIGREIAKNLHKSYWTALTKKTIKPIIYKIFDLKDAFKAHKLMESSKHLGKIVLKIK